LLGVTNEDFKFSKSFPVHDHLRMRVLLFCLKRRGGWRRGAARVHGRVWWHVAVVGRKVGGVSHALKSRHRWHVGSTWHAVVRLRHRSRVGVAGHLRPRLRNDGHLVHKLENKNLILLKWHFLEVRIWNGLKIAEKSKFVVQKRLRKTIQASLPGDRGSARRRARCWVWSTVRAVGPRAQARHRSKVPSEQNKTGIRLDRFRKNNEQNRDWNRSF